LVANVPASVAVPHSRSDDGEPYRSAIDDDALHTRSVADDERDDASTRHHP
jgi:hypothetical protein